MTDNTTEHSLLSRRAALLCGIGLAAGAVAPATAAQATALPERETTADTFKVLEPIELWRDAPPGGEQVTVTEEVVERPHPQGLRDRIARGVRRPSLTPYLPTTAPRAAVLVIPGGGYKHVVIDKEGYETAEWLARQGYAAFVLRYRLPGDRWAAGPDAPLQDAQRAMRVVRSRCAALGIDPRRTVVLGFSAGGHLAARVATRFDDATYTPVDAVDRLSARPDAAALLYPVITLTGEGVHAGSRDFLLGPSPTAERLRTWSAENGVTPGTPPTLIVHAADDTSVPLRNAMLMFDALRAATVPVDLHVFARGGHGFGLRAIEGHPVAAWPTLFADWVIRQPGFAPGPRA
jgi:acetyl esterase/lipase